MAPALGFLVGGAESLDDAAVLPAAGFLRRRRGRVGEGGLGATAARVRPSRPLGAARAQVFCEIQKTM